GWNPMLSLAENNAWITLGLLPGRATTLSTSVLLLNGSDRTSRVASYLFIGKKCLCGQLLHFPFVFSWLISMNTHHAEIFGTSECLGTLSILNHIYLLSHSLEGGHDHSVEDLSWLCLGANTPQQLKTVTFSSLRELMISMIFFGILHFHVYKVLEHFSHSGPISLIVIMCAEICGLENQYGTVLPLLFYLLLFSYAPNCQDPINKGMPFEFDGMFDPLPSIAFAT
ncbi:hypothetical protein ACJX0J_014822, partial [Zea mays]